MLRSNSAGVWMAPRVCCPASRALRSRTMSKMPDRYTSRLMAVAEVIDLDGLRQDLPPKRHTWLSRRPLQRSKPGCGTSGR